MKTLTFHLIDKLKEIIIKHEGYRQYPYKDTTEVLTIGIGRNLEAEGISKDEASFMLLNDLDKCESELILNFPEFMQLNDCRKIVLLDMTFNIGITGLMHFQKMLAALKGGRFEDAANEMLASKWATQVPGRAEELAQIMRNGII